MMGIIWMPVDPVPMMATRLPATSTPWVGQRDEWCQVPSNRSRPAISGTRGADRLPLAMMQNRALTVSPVLVVMTHTLPGASYRAQATRVLRLMYWRSSNRSAT